MEYEDVKLIGWCCYTCKHWEDRDEAQQMGFCRKILSATFDKYKVFTQGKEGMCLITGCNFYCNNFCPVLPTA